MKSLPSSRMVPSWARMRRGQLLLGRKGQGHPLFGLAQTFSEALLHDGDQNVLLGLEMIERAARVHAGRGRDIADRGAVEALLAKQLCGDAQQCVAPVALVVAACRPWFGFRHARAWPAHPSRKIFDGWI